MDKRKLAFFIIIFFSVFFCRDVYATETSVFNTGSASQANIVIVAQSSSGYEKNMTQEFMTSDDCMLSSISLYISENTIQSDNTITLKIFKSRNYSDINSPWYNDYGELVKQVEYPNVSSMGTGWINFQFDPFFVFGGDYYYFKLTSYKTNGLTYRLGGQRVSYSGYYYCRYADTSCTGSDNATSIKTIIYATDEAGEEYVVFDIDPTLNYGDVNFRYAPNQTCIVGETCYTSVTYSPPAIGGTIYIIPNIQGKKFPEWAVASSTLEFVPGLLEQSILMPDPGGATSTQYCYYLEHDDGDIIKCYATITWISSDTFDSYFNYDDEYEHACDNVATSTGIFDEFRYGVECGTIKAGIFLFYPRNTAVANFRNNISELKSVFPLNTYFDLTAIINDKFSTSTSMNGTLGIPFIDNSGTSTSYYIMPILSSSSMPKVIGEDNTVLFRTSIGYIIWIFTAGLCLIFSKIIL